MSQYKFYVYAFIRAKDSITAKEGTPYYVGKGSGNRAWSGARKVPKDRSRIVILESNLSEIGALSLERRYIRWFGRKDNNTGILYNRTDGGDGISGYKFSEEMCRKLSERSKGRKLTRDQIEKLHAGKVEKERSLTPEQKLQILYTRSKTIYTFTSPNGELFEHPSIRSFCKEHNLSAIVMYKNLNLGKVKSKGRGRPFKEFSNTIGWEVCKSECNTQ